MEEEETLLMKFRRTNARRLELEGEIQFYKREYELMKEAYYEMRKSEISKIVNNLTENNNKLSAQNKFFRSEISQLKNRNKALRKSRSMNHGARNDNN